MAEPAGLSRVCPACGRRVRPPAMACRCGQTVDGVPLTASVVRPLPAPPDTTRRDAAIKIGMAIAGILIAAYVLVRSSSKSPTAPRATKKARRPRRVRPPRRPHRDQRRPRLRRRRARRPPISCFRRQRRRPMRQRRPSRRATCRCRRRCRSKTSSSMRCRASSWSKPRRRAAAAFSSVPIWW